MHLPWCAQKCPYCDFNSHQADRIDERSTIDQLMLDLELDLPLVWGRSISSVFIGGGTPSLFSGAAIAQLLSGLRARLNLGPSIEITLEANPGSADQSHFARYREAGVNRLSLGVQSFNDEHLQLLGRIHDSRQALQAFAAARAAGFDNINLDLMYGLPEQHLHQATHDLQQALELGPEHISHYQLTIEPNTQFHHQLPAKLPDDETTWRMQRQCQQQLSDAGFRHYEVSAYAGLHRQCQHNLNYWQFGDYLGIGAGAHGKITLPGEGVIVRTTRARQPRAWLNATGEALRQQRSLHDTDRVFEFMLNALRLVQGFERSLFTQHTGLSFSAIAQPVDEAKARGLLVETADRLQPTELGLRFLNDLQAMFLDVRIPTPGRVEPVQDLPTR